MKELLKVLGEGKEAHGLQLSFHLFSSSEIPHYKKETHKPMDCVPWDCICFKSGEGEEDPASAVAGLDKRLRGLYLF